jgi:hypothetical protein
MPGALRAFVRSLERWPWQILSIAWLAALAWGCYAWYVQYAALGMPHTFWDILYNATALFTLNSAASIEHIVWQLNVARFLAPMVAAFTAVKALGLLLTTQAFRFRQHFAGGHVVVCGLGQRGLRLATELHKAGHRVIAIERDQADPLLESCRAAGVETITADATQCHVLRLARVDSASHVIAVCHEDAVNAAVAAQTAALATARHGSPHCLVHIVDTQLWKLLRERELGVRPSSPLRLEFFNIYESGARGLLNEFPAFGPAEADPRVLIVGLDLLGEYVLLRIAREWHRRMREGAAPMKLAVVDAAARERWTVLTERHPHLATACDFTPLELDLCSPAFERCAFLQDPERSCWATTAYVCLDDDTRALSAALALHRHTAHCGVPIVVRVDGGRSLAELLGGPPLAASEFSDIHAFSLLDAVCRPELVLRGTHETLARTTHEIYVREQRRAGRAGDNPLAVSWDDLPRDIKESNRRAADHVRDMLWVMGYQLAPLEDWDADRMEFPADQLESMAALEHERWMDERKTAGWRYGLPPRDAVRKTSPYLVPWQELPDDVRENDRATVRGIPSLLAEVGLQLSRDGALPIERGQVGAPAAVKTRALA